MKKYQFIDSLRGIAIIMVILVHSYYASEKFTFSLSPITRQVFISGQYGVQLFFLLSAITLFISGKKKWLTEENATANFFRRRFFRIAPLYFIAIIYYTIQNTTGFKFLSTGVPAHLLEIKPIVLNFLFLHALVPHYINSVVPGGWSIGVEMLFYCLVPLLIKGMRNLNYSIIFFSCSVFFMVVCNLVISPFISTEDKYFLYFYLPSQLPVFFLGIACYYFIIVKDRTVKKNALFLLLLSSVLLFYFGISYHISASLIFCLLIYYCYVSNSRILVNRVTEYIGKMSFSLYIVHFAAIFLLKKVGLIGLIPVTGSVSEILNHFSNFVIVISVSSAISYVTYNYYEMPLLKRFSK
ncbi:MAG: acyltransferase [Segetibacter sp.]|nr:acyltransferase [Segetibacter sp.]